MAALNKLMPVAIGGITTGQNASALDPGVKTLILASRRRQYRPYDWESGRQTANSGSAEARILAHERAMRLLHKDPGNSRQGGGATCSR